MKNFTLLGLVVLAAGASGCSVSSEADASAATAAPASAGHARTAPRPALATTRATAEEIAVWLPLTGQLRGNRETELAANAMGRVVATHVERGSVVKAGQTLATLDVRAAALSAAEARIQLENAQVASDASLRECERARALLGSGAVSRQEAERLEAQCAASTLSIAAARTRSAMAAQNVGDGVIRAPFAGVIAERFVDVGEYVRADSRVVTLVDPSSLRLELTVPEAHIARAQVGAPVRFSVAGYPDASFAGRISFVAGSVRPATRDVVAEAVVDNPEGILRSGMFASVQLQIGTERATVVPPTAVVARDGKKIVFVRGVERVEQRIVQPVELTGKGPVAIRRGVVEGEEVIVEPPPDLKNGEPTG